MKISNSSKGLATLEMLIAMTLIVLVISGVVLLVFGGQSTSIGSQTNQEALYKAQGILEYAKASLLSDFNGTVPPPTPTDGIYQQSLSVIPGQDNFTKQITTNISWGSNQHVTLSTLVTDVYSAQGICNPNLSYEDGWKNPQIYPSGNPPGFPTTELAKQANGNNSNGLGIGDIKVYRGKLYLAAIEPSNDNKTFYVVDLPADPNQTPIFKGSVATIGNTLNAVTVAPNVNKLYAYVANAYSPTYTSKCLTNNRPDSTKSPSCKSLM